MDEDELVFRRFPAEKQEQVRGLVNYAMLMGLSGKDLISIGGKLDRLKQSAERRRNKEIVESFALLPMDKGQPLQSDKFKIKGATSTYTFKANGSSRWDVSSSATKVTKRHEVNHWEYELGKLHYQHRSRHALLLDIAAGKFNLDF